MLSALLIARELLANFTDFFLGRWPIRFAHIAVEDEIAGFQRRFEFVAAEGDRQIVIVRADCVELCVIVHSSSGLGLTEDRMNFPILGCEANMQLR
jgi:hypothetical protein